MLYVLIEHVLCIVKCKIITKNGISLECIANEVKQRGTCSMILWNINNI